MRTIERGDAVIIRSTADFTIPMWSDSGRFLKRVAGMPGDNLELYDGKIVVNNQVLQERVMAHMNDDTKIKLRENEFFVLGDNLDNSMDSRFFGPIPRESIESKVLGKLWPK